LREYIGIRGVFKRSEEDSALDPEPANMIEL